MTCNILVIQFGYFLAVIYNLTKLLPLIQRSYRMHDAYQSCSREKKADCKCRNPLTCSGGGLSRNVLRTLRGDDPLKIFSNHFISAGIVLEDLNKRVQGRDKPWRRRRRRRREGESSSFHSRSQKSRAHALFQE